MGRRARASAPYLDGVQLRRREAVVRLSRCGMRPEGSGTLRTGALLPVPPLLRSRLREPAGERDAPCSSPGAIHPGEARREREDDGAVPREAQGNAPRYLYETVLRAQRGRDGAVSRHEGVAR